MEAAKMHFAKSAEKWAALYEAVKGLEGGGVALAQARGLFKEANPKITRDGTVARLLVLAHKGYIDGLRDGDGNMALPLNVKVTEAGHAFFRQMIAEAKELAAAGL